MVMNNYQEQPTRENDRSLVNLLDRQQTPASDWYGPPDTTVHNQGNQRVYNTSVPPMSLEREQAMYGKMIGYKKKSPLSKQHQFSLEEQHQESLQSDLRNAEAARRRYRNTAAEAAKASEKATEQELARLEEVSERERRYANADAQHLEPMGAQAVAMKRKERKGQMFPAVKLGHRGLGNPMMNSESNQVSQALSDLRKKLKARHVTAGQLFRMMDADRSNNLTREEFQRGLAMSGVRPVPPIEDIDLVYSALDVDKSRGISFEELSRALTTPPPGVTRSASSMEGESSNPQRHVIRQGGAASEMGMRDPTLVPLSPHAAWKTSQTHPSSHVQGSTRSSLHFHQQSERSNYPDILNDSARGWEVNAKAQPVPSRRESSEGSFEIGHGLEEAAGVLANRNGHLLMDLKKRLKARHVTAGQLFRMMDADRSNNLTKEEFQRGLAMSGVRPVPPLEDCEALFDSLDVDKSRGISFQELQGVLEGGGLPAPTSLDLTKAKGRLPVPKPAPIQTKANYSMDRPGSPGWEIRGGARNSNFVPKETPAPGGGWAVKAQKPR